MGGGCRGVHGRKESIKVKAEAECGRGSLAVDGPPGATIFLAMPSQFAKVGMGALQNAVK